MIPEYGSLVWCGRVIRIGGLRDLLRNLVMRHLGCTLASNANHEEDERPAGSAIETTSSLYGVLVSSLLHYLRYPLNITPQIGAYQALASSMALLANQPPFVNAPHDFVPGGDLGSGGLRAFGSDGAMGG